MLRLPGRVPPPGDGGFVFHRPKHSPEGFSATFGHWAIYYNQLGQPSRSLKEGRSMILVRRRTFAALGLFSALAVGGALPALSQVQPPSSAIPAPAASPSPRPPAARRERRP